MSVPGPLHVPPVSRRRFLAATGAGTVAAGLALRPGLRGLVEQAYAATPTACAPLSDIEHVVFLMQENRSFDHYFGTYPGVRGFKDPTAEKDPAGLAVFAQPGWSAGQDPDGYLLPYHLDTRNLHTYAECVNDISHNWAPQHRSWAGGRMDQWVVSHLATDGPGVGPVAMGYYERSDLEFYYDLADAFTLCDNYHCSVMGPTDPNRLYAMTGTLDPDGRAGGPVLSTTVVRADRFSKLSWKTMPEVLEEAGVSWKVYQSPDAVVFNPLPFFKQFNDPASPLFAKSSALNNFPTSFQLDIETGQLPAVSWIMPGLIQSEHPAAPPVYGEAFVAQTLAALLKNPAVWEKTVLFVNYDENGGFFDHVPPPVPPSGTAGEYLGVDPLPSTAAGVRGPIGLGFRVPMLVLSPYSRGGLVCSDVFDHTSMLRFLETRFGVEAPNITAWRRSTVGDLTGAFDFGRPRTLQVPTLVQPSLTDERVLAECLPGGVTGTGGQGPTYAVPANSWPPQEGGVRRSPTGPGVCTPPPGAGGNDAARTSVAPPRQAIPPGSRTLAYTGDGNELPLAGAALLAGAAAVGGILRRRSRLGSEAACGAAPGDPPTDDPPPDDTGKASTRRSGD